MCGIVGAVASKNVAPILLRGLEVLEYRGYDSAGVALHEAGRLRWRKTTGKVKELKESLRDSPLTGSVGISHTRWATHGPPTQVNSHPHLTERLALVHNGIIENHQELGAELALQNIYPKGESDTEILALYLDSFLARGLEPLDALRRTVDRVEGAYALAILFQDAPDYLVATRKKSPLCVAQSVEGSFLASDHTALPEFAATYRALEDGDVAILRRDRLELLDADGRSILRPVRKIQRSMMDQGKAGFRHFMHKEIHEQRHTVPRTIAAQVHSSEALEPLTSATAVTFLACGTSYHAAQIAALWFEELCGIPARAEIASEFRYSKRVLSSKHVAIAISQSGETADTLAALGKCKEVGVHSIALVNVRGSSMEEYADQVRFTHAGREVGVASTKAFTAQLAVLFDLALEVASRRNSIPVQQLEELRTALHSIHHDMAVVLEMEPQFRGLARRFASREKLFLLGRGTMYPLALEGALKVKETSYVHAEGFAAGELKHGTIALVEPGAPVLVLCPAGQRASKTKSNAAEVACRGADVIFLESEPGEPEVVPGRIRLPVLSEELSPFVFAVALQLLAYHMAVERKTDVDQPRNLAKSVTVE